MSKNHTELAHDTYIIDEPAKADERQLDEVTAEFLKQVDAESQQAQKEAAQEAAMPYLNQQKAALQIFIRQNKLEGHWRLQPDGKTLKREK